MEKRLFITFVLIGASLLPFSLPADEPNECRAGSGEADSCQCEGECQEGCPFYQCYPNNSIFQDSVVNEDYDEPPTWAWPGRRGGELSDELSR